MSSRPDTAPARPIPAQLAPHGPGRSAAAPQTPFFDSGPGIRSPRLRPCAQHPPAVPLDPRSAPRRAKARDIRRAHSPGRPIPAQPPHGPARSANIFPNFPAQTCPGSLFRPCHAPGQFFSIVRARSAVPRRLPSDPTQPPHGLSPHSSRRTAPDALRPPRKPLSSTPAPESTPRDSGPARNTPPQPRLLRALRPRRAKGCAA